MKFITTLLLITFLSACSASKPGPLPDSTWLKLKACHVSEAQLCREGVLPDLDTADLRAIYEIPDNAPLKLTTPPNTADARANFTNDFKGRATSLTYTRENGTLAHNEAYVTQFGLYNKTLDVLPLNESSLGNPADLIPTSPLAQEHHWMSFELLMKGQREYRECVGGISELHCVNERCPTKGVVRHARATFI